MEYLHLFVKSKVKFQVFVMSLLARVTLLARHVLESQKWQLIGMNQCYRSALCSHPLSAVANSWACGAACRHTTPQSALLVFTADAWMVCVSAPPGSMQQADDQFLSRVFIFVAFVFIFWLMIAWVLWSIACTTHRLFVSIMSVRHHVTIISWLYTMYTCIWVSNSCVKWYSKIQFISAHTFCSMWVVFCNIFQYCSMVSFIAGPYLLHRIFVSFLFLWDINLGLTTIFLKKNQVNLRKL